MHLEVVVKPIGSTPCLALWEWKVCAGQTTAVGTCYSRQAAAKIADEIALVLDKNYLEVAE